MRTRSPIRGLTLVLVAGLLVTAPLTSPASARPASDAPVAGAASSALRTVLVTMRDQADLRDVTGATRRARLRHVVDALKSTADQGQGSLRQRLETWTADGSVTDVEPLWVVDAMAVTASARVISAIAARPDVASVVPDEIDLVPAETAVGANLTALRAPDVWARGDTGSQVVVATLDTGVDVTHPDLETRWRGGTNSWFDPYGQHPGGPVDLSGHGTATLGAIVGGDTSGTAIGVAPGARWIAARVFDDRGATTTSAVHQAFQWLLDPDGDPTTADAPQVVNASWSLGSGPGCDLTLQPDVQALTTAGILPVFAAGNYGSTPGSSVSPANYPESLAVGALADPTTALGSSSRGPSTCGGRTGGFPDVAAPGQDILTTDRYGLYQVASGTSMAAPQVAGTLALMLSARPGLSVQRQREIITGTAVDLGPAGPDVDSGYGRVDALAAYDLASAPLPEFGVTAQPVSVSVPTGGSTSFAVSVAPTSGTFGAATVSASSSPDLGVTVTPSTLPGATGTSTVSVSTNAQSSSGDHVVTVDVTADGVRHSTSVTVTVLPAPTTWRIELSTLGNANPPGLGGTPDDADVLAWDGTTFRRTVDASAAPYRLPAGADVDGFSRRDGTSFYVSFADDVKLPGLGWVQDEDVVLYDSTGWRPWFDGTAHRLTSSALDLDAVSVVNGSLYFSTRGTASVPDVPGVGDDADVYSWDGVRFSRVWSATTHGLAGSVNVDGLDLTDSTRLALSFADTAVFVPGLGTVQDEDVVGFDRGTWTIRFDGTSAGLTSADLDVDAFDVP
jgi:subtilisin family serine protease